MTPEQTEAAHKIAEEFLKGALIRARAPSQRSIPGRAEYIERKREFNEASAEFKGFLKEVAHEFLSNVEDTAARARCGHWDDHVYLCCRAVELAACGEPLPPPLQEYMIVDAPVFKRRRGDRRPGNQSVDIAIAGAVIAIIEGRTRRMACKIVKEVLERRFKIKREVGAIRKAWEKYRHQATSSFLEDHHEFEMTVGERKFKSSDWLFRNNKWGPLITLLISSENK
jgi:hypothetical protein